MTRDVLIHAYFGVQLRRTGKVVREDLPELELQLTRMRETLIEDSAT